MRMGIDKLIEFKTPFQMRYKQRSLSHSLIAWLNSIGYRWMKYVIYMCRYLEILTRWRRVWEEKMLKCGQIKKIKHCICQRLRSLIKIYCAKEELKNLLWGRSFYKSIITFNDFSDWNGITESRYLILKIVNCIYLYQLWIYVVLSRLIS